MLRKGDHVWIDSSIGIPIGARVKITDTGQWHLLDDEGIEHVLSEHELTTVRAMHPTSVEGVDDMIRLGDLSEAGMLRNLLIRHKQGIIYTYTGSVLVAVNPYQLLPIYTAEQVHLYHGRQLGELPPHVFAVADSCYFNMRRNQRNQCCIISGESGAGKTESTKLILQFLAAVSGQHSWIEQQILQANPILEAFGNAKTVMNDNSSRFGKYVEIFFNKEGIIERANMEQYLLEKSRVCHQAPNERNYHIFYCLLAGMPAEQKKILSLGDPGDFKYLTKGECIVCHGMDDADEYGRIRAALKILTFKEKDCWEIFKLLAVILHMGNVSFEATILDNMESCDVTSSEHYTNAAKLLEVEKAALDVSLTQRSFMTNREQVSKPLSSEQAMDGKDAFVKSIYGRLFVWIFAKINHAIHKPQANGTNYTQKSIGLLDIFGFENFNTNSFEQLCINYANEQLQQFFVQHVFKLEQEEYAKEGISWKRIAFTDNQHTLDLLAIKPLNILALVDEESHFPKGTDATLLNKMNQLHEGSNLYIPSKSNQSFQFGIQHFAGMVSYDSKGFLEKNRDALSPDIIKLVEKSSNKLLRELFDAELRARAAKGPGSNGKIVITPKSSLRQVVDSRRQTSTLGYKFRLSLDSLMKALSVCQPFFIRCFKPNDNKISMAFDRELCAQQLRYSGMLETIRIRRSGYPIRHTFREFLTRYRVLLKSTDCDPSTETAAKCCEAICRAVITNEDDWRIGKTKIFLKDFHDSFLELERERALYRKATIIQRLFLGCKDRKTFLKKRRAAMVIQKHWRSYQSRREYRKLRQGFARLQSKIRSRQNHQQYQLRQAAVAVLQRQTRRYLARREWTRKREAVILLQAHTRGMLARKALEKMKMDAFLTAQEREAQRLAALDLQRRLEEVLSQSEKAAAESDDVSDEEMLENIFGFLPSMIGGQEGQAPEGFEDLERERIISVEEVDLGETRAEVNEPTEEEETLNKEEEEEAEEEDEFSFPKFAAMHFQGAVTHTHIQQRLRQPLLQHEDESDALACLTVWWIILRFMGDIPEPKQARSPVVVDSIQRKLGQRQARRLSSLVGLDQKLLRKKEKRKRADGTGKRRPSTIPEEITEETSAKSTMEVVKEEDDDILIGEGPTLDRPMTPLEKLHIIVGYAIVRQDIRDEIYCQICKQLVNNKNQKSSNRGWILLSICLGIFPPTNLLTDYLRSFLRHGPSEYASYCTERLQRTLANGEREEPPCWIELQATETKKPMVVSVTLMDGRSISLHLDSASTSAEICKAVKQKIGLRDSFGFSVYIALNEKVWSLGSGGRHVLDAVSQCEQEERRQGREEQHTPWRLYVRKELFTPWHDCSTDPVSTDLIYRQVIRSLKSGEYQSDKEDDYVQLAAKHYFVQHGSTATVENARKVVQECINLTLIESKSETKLAQLVNTAHKQGAYITSNTSADAVKAEVVDYARLKWPIYFSTFFQVSKISGPPLLQDSFVIAVNWSGLSFQEGKERMFFEFSYLELTGIQILSKDKSCPTVGLSTLRGDFVLRVERAEDMVELVSMFLSGLRDRSLYAVALQDTSRQDDPAFLSCKKGDVLFLIKDGKYSAESGWITARNERTVQSGSVSSDVILVLPTLDRPTDEVLSLLNLKPVPKQVVQNGPPMEEFSIEKLAHFSLKEFSFEHFRQTGKDVGRNARPGKERLWANSREPLKYPLLKSLEGNSTLSYLACQAFTAILKYMGDYPVKQARSGVELTNQIFGPATQHPELQDEIYCQIMKQMTSNGNGLSLERGWQLLWLCCGLFPPSALLLQNVQRFLESRPREPLASGCLQRLRTMLSIEARKLPPHVVEVDAIQQNSSQIFHKVHFPNELAELFEVTTTTRIRDLCRDIANHFKLSSSDGYSLFVKTSNKIVSMNSKQYFFDSLRELTDTPKKAKKVKEGLPMTVPYLVLFMRKLWFNVIPGKDVTADLMFHFPQELPKYLRGYHSVTREEMISLAGLLFRVKVDTDKSQFIMINRMLKDLVPADQIRIMSAEDWKKHIVSSYNKQAGITVEEAMVAFLKGISRWQTFGCAFFEVKQTSDRKLPSNIMIAISKQGVSIINPKTKEVLVMQPFSKITAWSSGNTYFSISLGSMVKGNTLLCETSLGYKMEDLLSSYVDMYLNERQSVRPRNQLFSLKPVIMV